MTQSTLCWQCSKPYGIDYPSCPHCFAYNANMVHSGDALSKLPRLASELVPEQPLSEQIIVSVLDYGRACADELPDSMQMWMDDVRERLEKLQTEAYAEGRKDEAEEKNKQEPAAYQQLVDGKWIECSYFVAYGWGKEISPSCRALYALPPQTQASDGWRPIETAPEAV